MPTVQQIKDTNHSVAESVIKECRASGNHCVTDGVINPEKYVSAKYRIMWVLKEANSENDSWSYLDNFKRKEWLENYGRNIITLRRIIYATYAILNESEWNNIPYANEETAFSALQEIALINIKKIPGGSSSVNAEIGNAYAENRDLLKKQIDTYDANIIIFGGTLNLVDKKDFVGLELASVRETEYGNHYYESDDKLYIHTWHPAVRGEGFKDEAYVMDIAKIVHQWKKK